MRTHKFRTIGVIAAMAAALFTTAGCPGDDKPDCDARPQPKSCASRQVVTDIAVVQGYLNSARQILGGKYDMTVVPAGKQFTCSDGTEVDGDSEDIKVCDGGKKLVIPTDVQYALAGYNRKYITYQLVLPATKAVSKTYATDTMQICAAAYITAKQENLGPKTAGEVDKALLKQLSGDDQKHAASTGVLLALNNKSVKKCAS